MDAHTHHVLPEASFMVFRFRGGLMSGERASLIAGAYVFIVSVILAGIAVVAHNNNEPQPEWLIKMNAGTGEFQPAGNTYTLTLESVDPGMLAFTPEMLQMTDLFLISLIRTINENQRMR